jgi:hypothetical protein
VGIQGFRRTFLIGFLLLSSLSTLGGRRFLSEGVGDFKRREFARAVALLRCMGGRLTAHIEPNGNQDSRLAPSGAPQPRQELPCRAASGR